MNSKNFLVAFDHSIQKTVNKIGMDVDQARMQHLREVSQVDENAVFPFVSNSGVFDLSHVSLSEVRCQHRRYVFNFMLLLIDQ